MANIFERIIDVLNKPLPGTSSKRKDEPKQEKGPAEQKTAPDMHAELAKREREVRLREKAAADESDRAELRKTQRELRNLRLEYEREIAKDAKAHADTEDTTYTVESGDTLWAIANRYYDNGNEWRKIYEANKGKIQDPNLIYPGQTFVIPDID